MTNLPPALAADRALVLAWVDVAMPGDLPPANVAAAQARCQAALDESRTAAVQPQSQLNATDRFKQTVREDDPKPMPAWNSALIGNPQSQSHERAADRFMRQRLERK